MTYKNSLPEITLKYKKGNTETTKISSSRDAYNVFKKVYDADTLEYCESVIVLFLNRANKTIGWFKVSQGGLNSTIVDTRMIMVAGLNCGASAFILSHNHPSGNIQPSQADINLTKKVVEGGKLLDIQMLDHIIVAESNYYSFADEGKI